MRRPLRLHQREILQYTMRARNPCLFVEMRLGKTLVTIRRIMGYRPRAPDGMLRVLVVAPSSALWAWYDELDKEGHAYAVLSGTREQRKKILYQSPVSWFLINKEGWQSLPEIASIEWDAVVCDESHFLKNPRAKITKFFMRNFRRVLHRWCLTGTPNPEGDDDMFCQLAFANGVAFGHREYWTWQAEYCEPHPFGFGKVIKVGMDQKIHEYVGNTAMVMRRSDVNLDVPKVYERRVVTLDNKIMRSYCEFEVEFASEIGGVYKKTKWAMQRHLWMRKLCGGIMDGNVLHQEKMKETKNLLSGELARDKVVVWCNFNDEVDLLTQYLVSKNIDAIPFHGGCVKKTDRHRTIRQFRESPHPRVMVMQQAIAQSGVNLSAASAAIYFSSPPGLLARKQTEDRIVDTEKKGPLLYVDIVVPNTVDEDLIICMLEKSLRSDLSLNQAIMERMKKRARAYGHQRRH